MNTYLEMWYAYSFIFKNSTDLNMYKVSYEMVAIGTIADHTNDWIKGFDFVHLDPNTKTNFNNPIKGYKNMKCFFQYPNRIISYVKNKKSMKQFPLYRYMLCEEKSINENKYAFQCMDNNCYALELVQAFVFMLIDYTCFHCYLNLSLVWHSYKIL